jgi:hypothetical protein
MKQTAVEWLVNQLSKNELFNIMKGRLSEKHNNFIKIEELINEAEQMEKEQHTLIWYNGWSDRHLSLLHENKQNNLNKPK